MLLKVMFGLPFLHQLCHCLKLDFLLLLLLQVLPAVQDKARDVAVDAMIKAAFESDINFTHTVASSIVSTDAAPDSRSDAIVVMSMLATDALIQVTTSAAPQT
jgi:hypothetical protein